MTRSPLTAHLRMFLGDRDRVVLFYVDIFADLQFVTLCDFRQVFRIVVMFTVAHGFDGFRVEVFEDPSTVARLERELHTA
jgi:hypothetical protein